MTKKKQKKIIRKETILRVLGKSPETFCGFKLNKGKYNLLFNWNTLENC